MAIYNKISLSLKITTLVFPVFFIFSGIKYKDAFLYFLALISFIFSGILLKPSSFSEKKLFINKAGTKNKGSIIKNKRLSLNFKLFPRLNVNKLKILILNFLFITGYLIYLAFIKLTPLSQNTNIVINYIQSLFNFFLQHKILALPILGLLIVPMLFFLKKLSFKKILLLIVTPIFISFLSFLISFLALYSIALFQINYINSKLLLDSSKSNLVSDKAEIIKKLQEMEGLPTIISSDRNYQSTLINIDIKNSKISQSPYYIEKIIPSIPQSSLLTINIPQSSILIYKNNLLVNEINKDDIELISPILGKLFAKQSLDPKYIKDDPEIKVLGRQEYLKYREEKINESVDKITEEITKAKQALSTIYGYIQNQKNNINILQGYIENATSSKISDYQYCISAGYYTYYYDPGFHRYYSDSECNSRSAEWDNIINKYKSSLAENQNSLQYNQSLIPDWQSTIEDLETLKQFISEQKSSTPQELGIFEPEKSIKIALDSTSKTTIADYIVTLTHEYLHFTSYVSEERSDNFPLFFEEGITELLARMATKQQLQTDTNLGYPIIVKIIQEITKKIPVEDLSEIYFTKDFDRLYQSLNKAYGKNFYEDSELYFTMLIYLNGENSLKYANNIMYRIGGDKLTEADLISSYSEF